MPPTVSGTVTDAAGNSVPWSASWTVTTPVTCLVGSSTEMAFPITVPSMGSYRHYFQPGDFGGSTQKTWSTEANLRAAYNTYGVRDVSVSFKDYNAAKLATFFASCPADLKFWCTYYHEHDGNIWDSSLTMAAYTAGCNVVADAAHAAGHLFGPIHNGSNRQNGTTGSWGYWPARWADTEAPLAKCDFWGFDTYMDTYQNPNTLLAPVLTYQQSHGLPLLIGETASPNTNATSQASWATSMRAWCLTNTSLALWWNNQFSGKPPYPMLAQTAHNWFGI